MIGTAKNFGLTLLLLCGTVWSQATPGLNRRGVPQPNNNPASGTWWRTPKAEQIGVTPEQRKKLDELWQQHRLRRIDLEAAVQKAQLSMEPLWQSDSPDEAKILAQFDRLSVAQAEVRKDELRTQLAMRHIVTAEQWRKLHEQRPPGPPPSPKH
jgi:Spy/CpxP family protein refolding chaperone